jgi:hypothetical protein
LFLLFFLKIIFYHRQLLHLIPSWCQQPEFHWWLPPQVLFIFFRPLLETHISCLVWTTMYDLAQFQKHNTSEYKHLLQWQQNRSKATTWLLYKNSSYSRVPKTLLLDWWLYVACYYSTTPTDCPCAKRGMSVGPPVAVNFEFCGYLRFLSSSFV